MSGEFDHQRPAPTPGWMIGAFAVVLLLLTISACVYEVMKGVAVVKYVLS